MKNTTLCYIEHEGCFLMLHRDKKSNDLNAQKWIGVGGKFEPGETADECLVREVFEETGLTLTGYEHVGVIRFISDQWESEDMYLYLGTCFTGELIADCPEGTLKWVPKEEVLSLPAWEGDKFFLRRLLEGKRGLCMTLRYEGDDLVEMTDETEPVGIITSPVITFPHAFSTRQGGVSDGIHRSLNLGNEHGDIPARVCENWRRFMCAAGTVRDGRVPERIVYADQVHGNRVLTVRSSDALGIYDRDGRRPVPADGFVTDEPYLPLAVFTADCIPLLLEDRRTGVIGAVHCGWRSTVADIMACAVKSMKELGSEPSDICAAIGPGIGYCCFEVGDEVIDAVRLMEGLDSCLFDGDSGLLFRIKQNGKYLLDLKKVIRERLISLGIAPEHITVSDECTMCAHDRYFSHRYTHGKRGSMASVIMKTE